ncbi:hypothetical protein GTP58_07785 [Duganella sp. CY15W]|nr:hypothetical protein [Duganella sp. CY15W]
MDKSASWHGYVATFCGISMVVIGGVLALNYQVDPYLIHQWETPPVQRLLPGREKLSPWGKTYALAQYRPDILYIGNSRTELGLPVRMPLFGTRRVFNGGLSGATLADAAAMVRHVVAIHPPGTVVWGIDAPSFSMEVGNTDFNRELVAAISYRRQLLNLKRALSLDMTLDSIRVLRGTFGQVCLSSLALFGQRDGRCVLDRITRLGGTGAVILPRVQDFVRGPGPTPDAMREFDHSVGELCQAGTQLRLYINPTHAMTSDALFWAGRWPALEHWQLELVTLVARYQKLGCDVQLFDFSGFNSITTEPPPQLSGQAEMQNYWEPSHYRVTVGRMVLTRLFGAGSSEFGVELTPASLAAHQSAQRQARDRYHRVHPVETAMVRSIL